MNFSKLRLVGFKSFVEATDFRIEPGLTGVVGPNGCGKSNLLEALRWVMGANSAKALRGEGMDDVIFSGSAGRPARNHAEVTLTIDNAEFDAPAEFNTAPILEVSRRIDRGEGSRFRINGREVRARDVQLVFADASTGANSPALVRQGQISELIAARPQNRRRILEEAAGVSGLHSRRHEVELRVRAAEANLARLDDVLREVETNLGRLRREARQAERYRRLAHDIRSLEASLLASRWSDAAVALAHLEADALLVDEAVRLTAEAAAAATTAALDAQAAIAPLREEETTAVAELHRLSLERDRLEHALENATAEAGRLEAEIARLDNDALRASQVMTDAGLELGRLETEGAQLEVDLARGPGELPRLRAVSAAADTERTRLEQKVEALAAEIAAEEANHLAAQARMAEGRSLLARAERALTQAEQERAAIGAPDDPALTAAVEVMAAARVRLEAARADLESAEQALASAAEDESVARDAARSTEDELGRLVAEARGLAGAASGAIPGAYPSVLAAVSVPVGLEAALAAALGDDLDASLDAGAPTYWRGCEVVAPLWPEGVSPLGAMISAPTEMAAAIAFTGVVDRAEGARLQARLRPGARLVSREGDIWRWDGFTGRAEAPRPAQVRLEQKSRLDAIEQRIDALAPRLALAKENHAAVADGLARAQAAAREARVRPAAADLELSSARDAIERLEREKARRESRALSLDETIGRFRIERDAAAAALIAAETTAAGRQASEKAPELAAARAAAAHAREVAAEARAALDMEVNARTRRQQQLQTLRADEANWRRRADAAREHHREVAADRERAGKDLATALAAPASIESRREGLAEALAAAQALRERSGDRMAQAESSRAESDRLLRAAEASAAGARESRASIAARLEAARDRVAEFAAAGAAGGVSLSEYDSDGPLSLVDAAAAELRLATLGRERDSLGAVNLRAEEEAQELADRAAVMRTERGDLAGALIRLRQGLASLNEEGRERLTVAFDIVNRHFQTLFKTLFEGGEAELRLVEADDPLEAGLEVFACPPGKRMAVMSLMSGGEQALTAVALIFAVFLANPAPVCFLDEVDAPLDDANVERFCDLLRAMGEQAATRFVAITHNPLTMSRLDRLFGVTMPERGVSQLVSVDLRQAEALAAQ